jgi:hypothetical protein
VTNDQRNRRAIAAIAAIARKHNVTEARVRRAFYLIQADRKELRHLSTRAWIELEGLEVIATDLLVAMGER